MTTLPMLLLLLLLSDPTRVLLKLPAGERRGLESCLCWITTTAADEEDDDQRLCGLCGLQLQQAAHSCRQHAFSLVNFWLCNLIIHSEKRMLHHTCGYLHHPVLWFHFVGGFSYSSHMTFSGVTGVVYRINILYF